MELARDPGGRDHDGRGERTARLGEYERPAAAGAPTPDATTGRGRGDREAAHRVLASGLPLELVPLDATRQAVLPRAGMRAALARSPGTLASRIQAFSERAFRISHADGSQGMALHDPLAVAVAVDSSLATWEAVRLAIGPDGETLRASGGPNCRLAQGVERDRLLRLFLDRLCPATSRLGASS